MQSPRNYKLMSSVIILVSAILLILFAVLIPGEQGVVATSVAVQIPQALSLAFQGLVLALMTFAFNWILQAIGWDITGFAAPLSISLSTFLLGLAQQWINLQPVSSDPTIMLVLNILVIVLSGVGVVALATGRRTLL